MKRLFSKHTMALALGAVCVVTLFQQPVLAAQEELEEIVVTSARLRAEDVRETPVSISLVSSEELDDLNITDMSEMAQMTPGLVIVPGRSADMRIRGIGASTSPGWEKSVSVRIDDFSTSKGSWARMAFFDVQQVEVLKGPQGVYLGKNATAGAVTVRTQDPTKEQSFQFGVGYEFEADEQFYEAVWNQPVGESHAFRGAIRYSDMDGLFYNVTLDDDGPNPEEIVGRLGWTWDISDNITNTLKVHYSETTTTGHDGSADLGRCQAGPPSPLEDCEINRILTESGDTWAGPLNPDGTTPDFASFNSSDNERAEWEGTLITNKFTWQTDNYQFSSLTSWADMRTELEFDADGSDRPGIKAYELDETDDFQQEFRLVSQYGGNVNFLVGAYYEKQEMDFQHSSLVFPYVLLSQVLPSFLIYDEHEGITRMYNMDRINNQESTYWGAYAEVSWEFNEKWGIDVGGRYTDVDKDNFAVNTFVHQITSLLAPTFQRPVNMPLRASFEDEDFSPSVTLRWTPRDSTTVFLSYTEAFKAGGWGIGNYLEYGTDSSGVPGTGWQDDQVAISNITFDSEKAEGLNVGVKTTIDLDGGSSLFVSAIYYQTEFEDLQVNVLDPETLAFTTSNAGKTSADGFDLDLIWQINDNWGVNFNGAWQDSQYDEHIQSCFAGQSVEMGCNVAQDQITGQWIGQDLSGTKIAPSLEFNFGVNYFTTFSNGMSFRGFVSARYSGDSTEEPHRRPAWDSPSYTRWDASFSLAGESDKWEIRLYGQNLTDEIIYTAEGAVPQSGGPSGWPEGSPNLGSQGDLEADYGNPRSYGLQFYYRL